MQDEREGRLTQYPYATHTSRCLLICCSALLAGRGKLQCMDASRLPRADNAAAALVSLQHTHRHTQSRNMVGPAAPLLRCTLLSNAGAKPSSVAHSSAMQVQNPNLWLAKQLFACLPIPAAAPSHLSTRACSASCLSAAWLASALRWDTSTSWSLTCARVCVGEVGDGVGGEAREVGDGGREKAQAGTYTCMHAYTHRTMQPEQQARAGELVSFDVSNDL